MFTHCFPRWPRSSCLVFEMPLNHSAVFSIDYNPEATTNRFAARSKSSLAELITALHQSKSWPIRRCQALTNSLGS